MTMFYQTMTIQGQKDFNAFFFFKFSKNKSKMFFDFSRTEYIMLKTSPVVV